jgi:hypothetical protein
MTVLARTSSNLTDRLRQSESEVAVRQSPPWRRRGGIYIVESRYHATPSEDIESCTVCVVCVLQYSELLSV